MNKPDLLRKVQDFMTRLNALSQRHALSQRRNEIAHGYVSKLTTNGEDVGHFLHPGSHMTHRNTTFLQFDGDAALGDYRYTAAQINHYTEEFRRLGGEVQDFINELRGKQNPGSPAS